MLCQTYSGWGNGPHARRQYFLLFGLPAMGDTFVRADAKRRE
jgi:hypothetical protein